MTKKQLFKCVNDLDKQSGFSIAPLAQYCSVASERVNLLAPIIYLNSTITCSTIIKICKMAMHIVKTLVWTATWQY